MHQAKQLDRLLQLGLQVGNFRLELGDGRGLGRSSDNIGGS